MRRRFIFSILVTFFLFTSIVSFGDDSQNQENDQTILEKVEDATEDAVEKTKQTADGIQQTAETSRDYRNLYNHNVLGNFSVIDTWIPFKTGLTYSYNLSSNSALEFEYLKGTVTPFGLSELGEFTDTRMSLLYRSFSKRNSFNYLYGLYYHDFSLSIGDKLLSDITGGLVPGYDVLTVKTLGVSWGVGNRWNLKRFLLAFDWFAINIPLVVLESEAPFLEVNTSDDSDKQDVRDVLDLLEKIPTVVVLKIQLGISF